jgi:hypothetical protein
VLGFTPTLGQSRVAIGMETNETRKGKYSKIILKEKKFPKMKKPNKE